METRTIPLGDFRLTDFLDAYTIFHRWWSGAGEDDSISVYILAGDGSEPMPFSERQDSLAESIERGTPVFFPFHEPPVSDDIKCLDGDYFVDGPCDPQLDIGEMDAYGFLLEVHDAQIAIQGALYDGSSGPLPTLTVQEECGVFDEQMEAYLARFGGETQ